MFGSSSRSNGGTLPAPDLGKSQERSTWRRALRKIKRDLFSSKSSSQHQETQDSDGNYVTSISAMIESDQQRLNQQIESQGGGGDAILSPQTTASLGHPKSPREFKTSNGFTFMKRTLSKSNAFIKLDTEGVSSSKDNKRAEKFDVEINKPPRPLSSAYIPTHAASDFSKIGDKRKLLDHPSTERPETWACVPNHAASGFSRANSRSKLNHNYFWDNQINESPLEFDLPANVPAASETDDESSDYQKFIAESGTAAERALDSHDVHSPNNIISQTEASRIMDEIEANYRAAMKEPVISPSKRSTVPRPVSRAGYFLLAVGEYMKPSEPATVYNKRMSYMSVY